MLAWSGALLLLALAAGAIVAAQPGVADRQRIVRGWLVEDLAGDDGGRLTRISRTSGPYRLEYRVAARHGADGVVQSVLARGAGCGDDEALDPDPIYHVREIRARLADTLARCGAPPRAVRSALRGLEPAYALALAWNWEAPVASPAASEPPRIYGPDEAHVDCDSVGDSAEEGVQDMNAMEAVRATAC